MSAEGMTRTVLFTQLLQAIRADDIDYLNMDNNTAGPELEELMSEVANSIVADNDDQVKALMQAAGFTNGPGPYMASGNIDTFKRLVALCKS